jgi:hypothetical protein
MIDLSNRLKVDPWFCMPHLADDDYIRRFAELVQEQLSSDRRVYVEYSHDVWNGMFAQHKYAGQQGQRLGFSDKPWEAAWRFNAYRSVQMFRIWQRVFGSTKRLVRVLASQAAVPHISRQILEFKDAYRSADALAIAPYISCNVAPRGRRISLDEVQGWSLDDALDYMQETALPEATEAMVKQKQVADQFGLLLLGYEAGQHMVGIGGVENRESVTKLFHAANADPRMGEIYRRYYRAWEAAGGDLLCHFSSVGRWSKWGSWGLLQYYDDDPNASPKFSASMHWARKCGQPVSWR